MDKNIKGILFIVGGVLSLFYILTPILFYIWEVTGIDLFKFYLHWIIPLVLVVYGIITLVSKDSKSETSEPTVQVNQTPNNVISPEINKVVNVTLTGGIIGMIGGSPDGSLNKIITRENQNGWKVIQIIPSDQGNLFINILRFIVLIMTLFFYTTTSGYYIILEKK
jgi:hypothetical protein